MKNTLTRLVIPALAGLALTSTAFAQAPGGGGFGGGGGRGGRPPFALGPISAIDAAAGTITITPQFGGQGPQTLKIGPDTQMVTQSDAAISDLKVGDQVQIMGMPTGITAAQVMTGAAPAFMQPGGGRGGGNNAGGGNAPAGQPQATATAYAVGKVFNTNPLTIAINDNMYVTLKLAPNGKVTRFTPETIGDLKVGDRVAASLQTADDGTLTATSVGVNLTMGGGMGGFGGGRGGRGGFGGGQGFGGPGGGQRGNNRRNNGGGGNNGGAPAGDPANANATGNMAPAGNGERENAAPSNRMEKDGDD